MFLQQPMWHWVSPHDFVGDRVKNVSTSCVVAGVKLERTGSIILLITDQLARVTVVASVLLSWSMFCRIISSICTKNSLHI